MSQLKGNFYLLVTLMLIVTAGYALPSDKEQTMHVVSDSADLSQKKP